jgi:hypothetical protein
MSELDGLTERIAEVLGAHREATGPINAPRGGPLGYGSRVWCSCGATTWSEDGPRETFATHQAEQVRAVLGETTTVPPGPCMNALPMLVPGAMSVLCELRSGHGGGHESGPTQWIEAP